MPGPNTHPEFHNRSVASALDQAMQAINPIQEAGDCTLAEAAGRVLASDLSAPHSIPPQPTSAMDGYALSSRLLPEGSASLAQIRLSVIGKSLAGHAAPTCAPEDGCIRIFTGAPVPEGFDLVIPQEQTEPDDTGGVRFAPIAIRPGLNIRARGEDIAQGEVAVAQGQVLGPREIALLASLGVAQVRVHRVPTVAVLSTGDELIEPGQVPGPSQIFDANRPMLLELVRRLGLVADDLGIVPDQPEALSARLIEAAGRADLIITSGGVSVGEADHTRRVLETLGQIAFWRLSIKPGRPLAFGHINRGGGGTVPFFGLPGNPVASFVTFAAVVHPCLERLSGRRGRPALLVRAQLTRPTKKQPGRTEYLRCSLRRQPSGLYEAEILASQGAASIKSLMDADGLAVLPEASGPMEAGDWVDVLPLVG